MDIYLRYLHEYFKIDKRNVLTSYFLLISICVESILYNIEFTLLGNHNLHASHLIEILSSHL